MTIPTNNTAFRVAERKYKQRSTELDLSDVVDSHLHNDQSLIERSVIEYQAEDSPINERVVVYEVEKFPGLFILPKALTSKTQLILGKNALLKWTHRTNLDAHYSLNDGEINSENTSKLAKLWLSEVTEADEWRLKRNDADESHLPSELVEKLRWALLGMEYQWLRKEYTDALAAKIPQHISDLCQFILSKIQNETGFARTFKPEVGIINFYRDRDRLTAHVDRSENNMEAPLVSFNVGRSCIFLVGSETTEMEPEAIFIHSGDVLVMSGEARKAFHGVPRILDINKMDFSVAGGDVEDRLAVEYLQESRINLNFRQISTCVESDST